MQISRRECANSISAHTRIAEKNRERDTLRRKIRSYEYDVHQFASDYEKLHRAYHDLYLEHGALLSKYNRTIEALRRSRSWRLLQPMIAFVHWIRTGKKFENRLELASVKLHHAAAFEKSSPPQLPPLSELHLEPRSYHPQKSWSTTKFISTYYYNQLKDLLAEKAPKGKKIFVQAPIIDWFVPLYQRPQHMALAMAKAGYLVFYMTSNSLGDRATGFQEVAPNVFITNQPVHLMLRNALVSFYSTAATLLAWHGPEIEKMRARNNLVLFEYIDHIDPEISFHTTSQLAAQFALIDDSSVDLALASAKSLKEELEQKFHETTIAYDPNGVDVSHYVDIASEDDRNTVPPELRAVISAGRPVIGYFGALAPWLWYDMLNKLAKARPDLSFVFIGPDYLDASRYLDRGQNIYAIGAVDYSRLPYYAQHFDAALIPFKQGDIAKTTSPLKLFEYFALGKPVVVTRGMHECEQFGEVFSAGSADEFSEKINDALSIASDPEYIARCVNLAHANTWLERASVLAAAHNNVLKTGNE
jgi:glycosyltransferase involved in cell wall biosynthesis